MAPTFSFEHLTSRSPLVLVLFKVIVMGYLSSVNVMADPAKDREECTEQLTELATCLPYVGGQAKSPTPDCCSGLKQVLKNNKKCLCVVIRDRNDPDLGLQINVTLALTLPSVCNAPANVSKCPELLNMDPNSPEAQVFYQLENNSTQTTSGPAPSPSAGGSISAKSKGVSPSSGNGQVKSGERWLGSKAIVGGVLLWNVMGLQYWFF